MPKAMGELKVCNGCHKILPITDFPKNKSTIDGLGYRCKPCGTKSSRTLYYADIQKSRKDACDRYWKDHDKKRQQDYTNRYKRRVLTLIHYGGNPPKCACCGEDALEFLCIDHSNRGGDKHRRIINSKGGRDFYMWLHKNGYPKGFRVLCHNCNMALGLYGYCPHQNQDMPVMVEQSDLRNKFSEQAVSTLQKGPLRIDQYKFNLDQERNLVTTKKVKD